VHAHQGCDGARIEIVAVIFGIQQFAVQIAVHHGCGELADLGDVRAERVPARLFGKPLRDEDERQQDRGRHRARQDKRHPVEGLPRFGGARPRGAGH
jgi:hypothetical protein